METASNPRFRSSLYHSLLFRYHVLGETSLPDPGYPPYYSLDFFSKIRQVHLETPLNVSYMSEKQWYQFLLEDSCIMEVDMEGNSSMKMCRVERASPGTDWEKSWRLARLPGLGPENTSFLLRMMHDILPTKERVARTLLRASPACSMPGCGEQVEDRGHALLECLGNNGVGASLMRCLRNFDQTVETEQVLRLELNVEEDFELPLVWMIASLFLIVWDLITTKSRIQLYEVRAQLEAKINLLRETRHSDAATILDQLVDTYL